MIAIDRSTSSLFKGWCEYFAPAEGENEKFALVQPIAMWVIIFHVFLILKLRKLIVVDINYF